MDIDIRTMRGFIGKQVEYAHSHCEIIEVLEDIPALVLQSLEPHNHIQINGMGQAHRRTPRTYTIPIYDAELNELTPVFKSLGLDQVT
jgi:NADPH-dependent ferric siderophore reductase